MPVQLNLHHFSDLFNAIPDAVLFVDADGIILQANEQVEQIFGYKQDALIGQSIETLIPKRYRAKHKFHREQFKDKPERRPMGRGIEIWGRRSDGSEFPADIMLSPIELDGIGEAVCCVVRDISVSYAAQKALSISHNRFQTVWDLAVDAIALSDSEGMILDANQAYFRLYGYTQEDIVGKSFAIIFPEAEREDAKKQYKIVYDAQNPPPVYEAEIVRANGERRIVESQIEFVKDKNGRRTAMISMIRDITGHKRAEEQERKHAQQLESLLEIGQELAAELDLDALLNLIVEHSVKLLDGVSGGIYLYRPDLDRLEWVVAYGPNLNPPGELLARGEGISGQVWTSGRGMIVDNYHQWENRLHSYDSFGWQAVIAAPVMWGSKLLGVINVLSDKPGAFTSKDKSLIEIFASTAATVINNVRLLNSEREQRLLAETLVEVTLALTVHTSFTAIQQEILKQTIRLVRCKTANIGLIKGNVLQTDHLIHYDTKDIESLENEVYPLESLPVIVNLVETGQPLIIKDTKEYPGWVKLPGSEWVRSFLALPISLHNTVIGVLRIDGEVPDCFSEADARRLAPLANAAAIALSKASALEMAQEEIYERIQAEEALLESLRLIEQAKQDWEATADSFDQIIGLLDVDGDLIRINRTVQAWGLGDFTRLKGHSIHELLHPDCADADCYFPPYWEKVWPKILAGGHDDFEVQDNLLGRYLRIQLRPILSASRNKAQFSDDSEIKSAITIIHDITEEKRAEEAIFHTQKLESLGVLAGGIAHDFNNLLAGILSENSLALLRLKPDEPARVNLERSVQTIEKAADLTRQLLAYTGKGQSKKTAIDLNAIIKENLLLLKSTVPRQVKLVTNLANGLPRILADSGQIQQVVMNLILNAAEAYEKEPGNVVIKTWTEMVEPGAEMGPVVLLEPGQYVCFEVADKAMGMDEETLARIYDPFFTTKFTGRGLGLAAVSGIIRHHDGDIQVESRLGQGTTFKVMFPATERQGTPEKSGFLSSPVKNGCVLVIDDELSIRVAIADFLSYFGQQIITAEDGRAGLALFKEQSNDIDLVILDLTMPSMSGGETLIELHKIRPELPVILLSGFSEEEALEQIDDSNHVDFLQKPFRLPALVEKLNAMMG